MRFLVPSAALLLLACGGTTEDTTALGESCTALAEACHHGEDMGDAPSIACHDIAHEGDEAACEAELDPATGCVAACDAAAAMSSM